MKTTYKITITEAGTGNKHLVPGQSEFNDISSAIEKALSECLRLKKEYGTVEDAAKETGWNESEVLEKHSVELELQKVVDGETEELTADDYGPVGAVSMMEFEHQFNTIGWAICKTQFFHLSE